MAVFNRLFWVLLVEALSFAFSITADAQIVRIRGDQQVCHGTYCTIQSSYGSGTVIAHAGQYKPGKSLVLGCGHQFERAQFSSLSVQGKKARLLHSENVNGSDLSLVEVDHDFGTSLSLADDDLPAGAKGWATGFGGDGVCKETAGEIAADASISAQTRIGDSGGPVLSAQNLVCGVLWGQENIGQPVPARARFTCVRSIKRFVERHGYARYVIRSRVVSGGTAITPRVAEPRPTPAAIPDSIGCRDPRISEIIALITDMQAQVAALRADAARLESLPGPPGQRGPQGERGPAGATGSPGQDGADAHDLSDAQVRRLLLEWLTAHAADLKGDAGPAGPIGATKLEIRFKGAVVDTLTIPAGKKAVKDLDELLTPE